MKNKKALIGLLATVFLASAFFAANVKAAPFPNLPATEVTMHQNNLTPHDYPFVSLLSNVPGDYDVTNATYTGWCIDLIGQVTRGVDYQVLLYSSLSLSLPAPFSSLPWDMINYVLNHKLGTGTDISQAIWYFANGNAWPTGAQLPGYPFPLPPSANAQTMVTDALTNGAGYIPGPDEIVAVICAPTGEAVQDTIIELRIPIPPEPVGGEIIENPVLPNLIIAVAAITVLSAAFVLLSRKLLRTRFPRLLTQDTTPLFLCS